MARESSAALEAPFAAKAGFGDALECFTQICYVSTIPGARESAEIGNGAVSL